VDLVLPECLDIEVVTAGGARVRPVMLHHAVLGSIERFTAVLLEHHRGALPFWLAPDQILVAPITADQQQYACDVADAFTAAGLRCTNTDAQETLARRIATAHERNIPVIAIAGATEAAAGSISLRERGGLRSTVSLAQAVQQLAAQAVH
jgi:threonyl-tRNA synthetase